MVSHVPTSPRCTWLRQAKRQRRRLVRAGRAFSWLPVLVPILFALLASITAAWSLWRRVLTVCAPHDALADGRDERRVSVLGHAALLGVLVGLAVAGGRAPLATAVAACLAWTAVATWMALATREGMPLVWTDAVRQHVAIALGLAALPVSVGTVIATGQAVPGSGVPALLGGWFVASVGVSLWHRLASGRSQPAPPPLPERPDHPPYPDDDPAVSPWA